MADVDAAAVDNLRARLLAGEHVRHAPGLPARAERALQLAVRVGAPALPALDAAMAARADDRRREEAVSLATAQTRAVTGGLGALAVVAVPGLGALLGVPLWRFYLTRTGIAVAALAAGLVAAGLVLAWRLVRRVDVPPAGRPGAVVAVAAAVAVVAGAALGPPVALTVAAGGVLVARRPRPPGPPRGADEVADLLATALAGGLGPAAGLRAVADALPDHRVRLRRMALGLDLSCAPPATSGEVFDRILAVLETTVRWGAPAGPALRRVAHDLRAAELARVLAAAERLPALLTFPTALCLLPACVLVVAAPLVAHGLDVVSGAGM